MSFSTHSHRSSQFNLYGATSQVASGVQPRQVLEVRSRLYQHLIVDEGSDDGLPNPIFHEGTPIPLQNAIIDLPLHRLEIDDDPVFLQIYIAQSLASLNIDAVLCETMAGQVASCILHTVARNREINFHIAAVVDHAELTLRLVEQTAVVEETPRKVKMEKVEEIGKDLGDCSICLDGFINSNKTRRGEVVKIPCGHVYHKSCIFKWLHSTNSCPLCRTPLPFE